MMALEPPDPDDEMLEPLLGAVYERYHYDFRGYHRGALRRGVERARATLGIPTTSQLIDRVVREPNAFTELLRCLTVRVSDLFRDPDYFLVLRDQVMAHLATYPSIRIWVAGCGTGEEAYSFAILLHEAGLLERSLIYATDIDTDSLRVAESGGYELDRVPHFTANYFQAGGRASLANYYSTAYERAAFLPMLRDRVLFSDHSLATDAAFAEVQVVSCRNVLIYFDRALQDRAIGLFRDALCPRGFLGLGSKETLTFSAHVSAFETFSPDQRIYRRQG